MRVCVCVCANVQMYKCANVHLARDINQLSACLIFKVFVSPGVYVYISAKFCV